MEHFELIVIGSGPGGYEAAIAAAEKGMRTALIEKEKLGGTCLNYGCIPTKAMIHAASFFDEIQKNMNYGIHVQDARFDMNEFQRKQEEVIEKLQNGISFLLKKSKVSLIYGTATIYSEHEVVVQFDQSEQTIELSADYVLIATGAESIMPNIPGVDLPGVMDSKRLIQNHTLPAEMLIVGGGVIGMEFASIYQALGTQVTVVELGERILGTMDKEISQNLKMIMKKRGISVFTKTSLDKIEMTNERLQCYISENESKKELVVDTVLFAVGRKAYTEQLFMKDSFLSTSNGKILVNEHLQTSIPNIYAIGDVIGGMQLAHVATAEGISAVLHMRNETDGINREIIPSCVYTDPEIAEVGLNKEEADACSISTTSRKYSMNSNAKSVVTEQERGFIKVLVENDTGRILGAQMMCARATDMISEFAVAIANQLTLEEMEQVIRPHPTFSEGISEITKRS